MRMQLSVATPQVLSATIVEPTEPAIVGRSPAMSALLTDIERVASTDVRGLITGERGVGTHVIASHLCALGESCWPVVQVRDLNREITRADVQTVVRQALTEARGNDKRFLDVLRRPDCLLPYRDFR